MSAAVLCRCVHRRGGPRRGLRSDWLRSGSFLLCRLLSNTSLGLLSLPCMLRTELQSNMAERIVRAVNQRLGVD